MGRGRCESGVDLLAFTSSVSTSGGSVQEGEGAETPSPKGLMPQGQ